MDETDLRPAIALLLADAFRFTEAPTAAGREAFLDGMRLLGQSEPPTLEEESDLCRRLLETGWELTASFDAERWAKLGLPDVAARL